MMPAWFAIAAIVAATGVALGAFGAHALSPRVSPDLVVVFETGVRYQMYHAFALLAVAYAAERRPGAGNNAAGFLFLAGIVIFSGSLYLMTLTGARWLGAITPIGGMCFIAGWIVLALTSLRDRSSGNTE